MICSTCKKNLDDQGYVEIFDGKTGAIRETVCDGCDQARRMKEFRETGYLSTWLVERAHVNAAVKEPKEGDDAILDAFKLIQDEIPAFEQEVWFSGLQAFARGASTKGTKSEQGDFTLMCFTMCARAMITLEDKTGSVTLITAEDSSEPRMGFRGVQTTADHAVALIRRARQEWTKGNLPMAEDRKVTLGIPGLGGAASDQDSV